MAASGAGSFPDVRGKRPNLATLVDDWRKAGAQTAIVRYTGNRSVRTSYAALASLTDRIAAELERRGIAPGERVLLWGENSAEWVAAFFACIVRGLLVVPLDAAGTVDFAARVLTETTPQLILGDATLLASLETPLPHLVLAELPHLPAAGPCPPVPGLHRKSPLQILFTSGTTSEPKGIVHTHGNVLASVEPIEAEMRNYRRYERWFHPLRFLHTLPLSHVFGQFMGLWLPPLLAAEVHFENRLEAERIVRTLRRERITLLAAVPRLLDLLRSYLAIDPLLLQAASGESVWRRIWHFRRVHRRLGWKFWAFVCGGASLAADLEEYWNRMGFAVIQGYGMTETAALVTLNHPFRVSRGSIGKPLPGRDVRLGPEGEISVRGEMVSTATWQNGQLIERQDPWLATGDLATQDQAGNLRFTGRRSEIIVNASGVNIHPEDIEAALLRQPPVTSCAVVALSISGAGQEPAAVLVAPAGEEPAAAAVRAANAELAGYQQVRHWFLWRDGDLPRTATGKIQRRKVAEWVAQQGRASGQALEGDSLTTLIASLTGIPVTRTDEDARLAEDLHLDSLGRMQLQSAVEARFGTSIDDRAFLKIETLGQLRTALAGQTFENPAPSTMQPFPTEPPAFRYPRWPWSWPVQALRIAFVEVIVRPLVWLFAKPRVELPAAPLPTVPMLLIANHVTWFDVGLVLYALPPHLRRRLAVATAGEMLEDWRHARNQGSGWANALGPIQYWLVTALLNAFPLPRQAGFRRSFAHAGEALDRGFHVLIFPEGRRSPTGELQPFRAGIGLLAETCNAPVLPIALRGMRAALATRQGWFHAGRLGIRVGQPIRPMPGATPEAIALALHAELSLLLDDAAVSPANTSC